MRGVLPGKPQAKLQAVTYGLWEGNQIIAYISGNALIILDSPTHVLQTTYIEEEAELEAVNFDEDTGKIAACSERNIYIYKPYGQDEGALKWSLQGTLPVDDAEDSIKTLSWGLSDELLVGSSSLSLYSTHNTPEEIWTKKLASPVKYARFSPDASFIASTGTYDRLLKIWRRLAFGSADQRFDYSYLPHPLPITSIHWRRPFHKEQSIDNVLYTVCADNKVRIWVSGEGHGSNGLQIWAEIDLIDSIQLRVPVPQEAQKRYVFFIDSRDFTHATTRAVERASIDEKEISMSHLIEVANRNPEICVVLDDRGNMSAWGLENIGARDKKATDVFNIAHVDGLHLHFAKGASAYEGHVQLFAFCGDKPDSTFTLLSHHFDGRVEWLESRINHLFDLSSRQERLQRKATWTGHSHAIKKVNRTASGRALISRTETNESIVWVQRAKEGEVTLHRHSIVQVNEHIHRTWLLQEGDFVVFLHHDSVSLWDSRGPKAAEVARCQYTLRGKPLCLILIPEVEADSGLVHVATVSSEMKGIAWEIKLPPKETHLLDGRKGSLPQTNGVHINGHADISMTEFDSFDLGDGGDLKYVLPVDPAGTAPVISGFLDTFARDIAISYSNSGIIKTWTARIDREKRKLEWLLTATVDTDIANPSLASGTSIRKAALVDADKTTLTIWNTRSAQLEYEERFEGNGIIQDLDWSSTPDNQSILAVGFPHRVVIYAQLRYDYLNAGPSWVQIRDIRIRDITPHPIGDSVWLGSGNLVIGAGNQLFVQDEHIEVSDDLFPSLRLIPRKKKAALDIFTAVSRLNGPLPVYHPQLISQCVLAGKMPLVHQILINLYKKLKFFTEGDELDPFLELTPDDFSHDPDTAMTASRKELQSSYADFTDDDSPQTITEDLATHLNEILTTTPLPLLSSREQFHLADIIECIGTVEKHRRSIDTNAGRFLLFFRQHVQRDGGGRQSEPVSWREIVWAFHSGSQDIVGDLVGRHWGGRMGWKEARGAGMFMWMTDLTALRAQFEIIARNEYTKTEERNPVDCSLYYLALKKKAVLVGLWRMATWSREQGATHRLLSNNFQEERWKTAALKNAYALMGKRRFEYASAFFLLADHLRDAVNVLHNQLGDTQLAIAVARVYEGDDGPVLREFLNEKILPQAAREGNRWLATWAFWMLNKRDSAVRALVQPLPTLLPTPTSAPPTLSSKLFLTDDAALIVLYKQLREKSLQALHGAVMVSPRAEWEFVLHTARLWQRMGCDILGLDLVRTWEFLAPQALPLKSPRSPVMLEHHFHVSTNTSFSDGTFDPRKLLRRRSSLVVGDMPVREHVGKVLQEERVEEDGEAEEKEEELEEKKMEEKKKPPPTQFQEPDASSLLDAFGF